MYNFVSDLYWTLYDYNVQNINCTFNIRIMQLLSLNIAFYITCLPVYALYNCTVTIFKANANIETQVF